MAGWDGSGNFVRNYNWTVDAASGIKILSSKMDTEFNTYATGLMNCLTRDGQTKPSANQDWNGYKITNLLPGTASTDAATVGQLAGEWAPESNAYAWVAATQIKLTGADLTATYHVGRRIKFLDNGTQKYATITVSAFSVDTTLTLVVDGGAALTGPTTALSYGILSYVNRSYLDPKSIVVAYPAANQTGIGTAPTTVVLNTAATDLLSELGSNVVTVKYPGYYRMDLRIEGYFAGTVPDVCLVQLLVNGSLVGSDYPGYFNASINGFRGKVTAVRLLAAGDTIGARVQFTTGAANYLAGGAGTTELYVERIL